MTVWLQHGHLAAHNGTMSSVGSMCCMAVGGEGNCNDTGCDSVHRPKWLRIVRICLLENLGGGCRGGMPQYSPTDLPSGAGCDMPPGGEERDDRYCRRSAAPPPSQTPDLLISTETEPKSGPEVRFPGRRNPMESCDRRDNWSPTPNHTNAAERDPAGNQRIRFAFGPKAVPRQVQSKQRGTHRPATPQTSVPTSGP